MKIVLKLLIITLLISLLCLSTLAGPPAPKESGSKTELIKKEIQETGKAAVYGIYFDTNKATVKEESTAAIEDIVNLLKDDPHLRLYVVGHTDSVGDFDYNMKLSKARAESVVKILTRKYGIANYRLKAYGVGPLTPVASNKTSDGRAKNRRVELVEQ